MQLISRNRVKSTLRERGESRVSLKVWGSSPGVTDSMYGVWFGFNEQQKCENHPSQIGRVKHSKGVCLLCFGDLKAHVHWLGSFRYLEG